MTIFGKNDYGIFYNEVILKWDGSKADVIGGFIRKEEPEADSQGRMLPWTLGDTVSPARGALLWEISKERECLPSARGAQQAFCSFFSQHCSALANTEH